MVDIPTCQLKAKLYLIASVEGGRQTAIRKDVYRPQFHLGSANASCRLDGMDTEVLWPGEEAEVELTLVHPERFGADLRVGQQFEIKEGSRTVGRGTIKDVRR